MEEEIYVSIDRYLANEMEERERLAFEERLKHDNDLTEKVAIYQAAAMTLTDKFRREEGEAAFKHNVAEIVAGYPVVKEAKVVKLNWYAWAAAASVALLCIILFVTKLSKPDYNDFAIYEPIALVERGQDNVTRFQAQQAFNKRQYKFAVVLFNKLLEQDENNAELELYKGIALLESNRVKEANEMFNQVRKSESVYRDNAVWMLALSALKEKDYKKCEAFLNDILPGSSEYEDAQRLLGKL